MNYLPRILLTLLGVGALAPAPTGAPQFPGRVFALADHGALAGADHPSAWVVCNVERDEVASGASPRVRYLAGFEGATIGGVRFKNHTLRGVFASHLIKYAGAISFRNVLIESATLERNLNSNGPPPPAANPDS